MAINKRVYFPIIIAFLSVIIILSLLANMWSSPDDVDVVVLDDSLTDPLDRSTEDSQIDFLLIEQAGVNDDTAAYPM